MSRSFVRCRVSYVSRRTERERIVAAFESSCTVKEARKNIQKILSGLRGAGQSAAVKTLWVRAASVGSAPCAGLTRAPDRRATVTSSPTVRE